MIPQKVIDSLKDYLKMIFSLNKKSLSNNDYILLAENEEEREDLQELCAEIDDYYKERENMKASKLKGYMYLEQQAIKMYKEENPNATEYDCSQFLGDLRNSFDQAIFHSIDALSKDTSEIIDDTEHEVMFMDMIENNIQKNLDIKLSEDSIFGERKEQEDE